MNSAFGLALEIIHCYFCNILVITPSEPLSVGGEDTGFDCQEAGIIGGLATTSGLPEKVTFEYHIGHGFSDFHICQMKTNKDSVGSTN